MIINNIVNKYFKITKFKLFIAKILYCLTKLFYKKNIRKINRHGVTFEIDLSEGIELHLFLFGNFQKHVINNKLLNIPKDSVIFDVGANVGTMSLFLAKKHQLSTIYAFEPTYYAMNKFKKNLSLNPELGTQIHPIQCFISSKTAKNTALKAYSSWKISEKSQQQHYIHGGTAMPANDIPSVSLDDFCIEHNITRLDFIKIDTDGHEFDVFLGSENIINKFKPIIVFEIGIYVMEDRGITFEDYLNYFNRLNYILYTTKEVHKLTKDNYKKYIPHYGTIDVIATVSS